jgi:hypothetical protein
MWEVLLQAYIPSVGGDALKLKRDLHDASRASYQRTFWLQNVVCKISKFTNDILQSKCAKTIIIYIMSKTWHPRLGLYN